MPFTVFLSDGIVAPERPYGRVLPAPDMEGLPVMVLLFADRDGAVPHFRAAHRLTPENWTYKRQAWFFEHPLQAPTGVYDGDWVGDVRAIGAENYYPPLDL